jgi:hypothetical protein
MLGYFDAEEYFRTVKRSYFSPCKFKIITAVLLKLESSWNATSFLLK